MSRKMTANGHPMDTNKIGFGIPVPASRPLVSIRGFKTPRGQTGDTTRMDTSKQMHSWRLILLLLGMVGLAHQGHGQWVPPAELRNVPVLEDCKMTRHGVGVAVHSTLFYPKGAIFLCPERERAIDARHPGASRFFLIHEYGHLAMRTREEAIADEWAAKQLASVPGGRSILQAVLLHFADHGALFDPLYGTGFDRALRIARAAGIGPRDWPASLLAYEKSVEAKTATGTELTLRRVDGYTNAAQMIIRLDRQTIGFLSNVDENTPLELPKLAPGRHLVQAAQVWLYHTDPSGTKSEVTRGLQAETEFNSTGANRLAIDFRFDGDTLAIQIEELPPIPASRLGSQVSPVH
jgi:hypothetical protein